MTAPTPSDTTPPSTDPGTATLGTEDSADDRPACSVCPHPWSAHDRLGVRFCTATAASLSGSSSASTRGCICV